jgi:hypothetical protein
MLLPECPVLVLAHCGLTCHWFYHWFIYWSLAQELELELEEGAVVLDTFY